jgi:lysophospholipase L1-like esterase
MVKTASISMNPSAQNMPHFLKVFLALAAVVAGARAAEPGAVIDHMDEIHFRGDKGTVELVDGKIGKAVKFAFPDKCQSVFFTSSIRGKPEWDDAAGFSFWVKGDGSNHFGGLQFIYDDDFAVRYDYMFPIKSTEWTKVTVAWSDLIPVLPGPKAKPLGRANKPSKLSALWVGKWWYWRDYAAHSFALDELCLEKTIATSRDDFKPAAAPLQRTLAKLKEGKPVTIVTMGDSLTDDQHWANKEVSWTGLLEKQIKDRYKVDAVIVNPAIGGTQLRQNLVLMPRWLEKTPAPDLVTICFGFNDWDSGMRGAEFLESYRDAVERVRRATKGKTDVLVITTLPSVERWTTMDELAEACRKAARDRKAGLADAAKAFHLQGKDDKEKLYCRDKTHLGPAGHELLAQTVQEAIEKAGE